MANMSYCRWQNTKADLQDCLAALDAETYPASYQEQNACRTLFEDFLDWCAERCIIDGWDVDELKSTISGGLDY